MCDRCETKGIIGICLRCTRFYLNGASCDDLRDLYVPQRAAGFKYLNILEEETNNERATDNSIKL